MALIPTPDILTASELSPVVEVEFPDWEPEVGLEPLLPVPVGWLEPEPVPEGPALEPPEGAEAPGGAAAAMLATLDHAALELVDASPCL